LRYLLIDIGNSEVKAALGFSNRTNVKLLKRFSHSKSNFEKEFIKNLKQFRHLNFDSAGVSVQDFKKRTLIKKLCKKIFNISPVFVERKMVKNIKIDYSESLGIDRICNVVAAVAAYGSKNLLVIDFGTATTFTIASNKELKGGLICPGLITALKALSANAKLPKVKINKPDKLYFNDTVNNITAGGFYQTLFSVKGIMNEFRKQFKNLKIITTGGLSNYFTTELPRSVLNDMQLTLKGIKLIIER